MNSKIPTLAEQFGELRQQRSVVAILLFLLVAVVFWVGLGLFSSQQKFAVPKAMRDLARPLSPIVDEAIFDRVEQKRAFAEDELQNFTIYKVVVNDLSKQFRLVDIKYQSVTPGLGTPLPVASDGGTVVNVVERSPTLAPSEGVSLEVVATPVP